MSYRLDEEDEDIYSLTLDQLLEKGYRFVVWTPDELEGVSDDQIDHMIGFVTESASEFLSIAASDGRSELDNDDED